MIRIALLVACAGLLMSCSSGAGSVRAAPGVRVLEPGEAGDGSAVALMTLEPTRGFRVVGLVRSEADARFEGQIGEARSRAEAGLRGQGALVGADAVVVDESDVAEIPGGSVGVGLSDLDGGNLQRPGGAAYATRPVHRVTLRGRAIVFTRGPTE